MKIISWVLRLTIAVILLQTLYFKFTAHPDSVHIFSALGVEPFGRIGLGVVELITAFLVLYPTTKIVGILTSFGIICGAIGSHFLVIGLNVQGDGGTLFGLALVVFAACAMLFFIHSAEFLAFFKSFLLKNLKKI